MRISLSVIRFLILPLALLMVCTGITGAQALRVSANRHYLEFHGKPILPIGDSVTQGWMECGTDFDQRAYLNALAARGINVVLLWSYIGTSAEAQRADERIGYDAPEIWPWRGSPDEHNFDLTHFNAAYFQRLRAFVRYAESKRIIVVLTVQDGWTKTRFAYHPFNAALGNGPLTEGRQFVDLADYDHDMPTTFDSTWTWQQQNQWFQEHYAEKLCAELKDCPNVIFEMFNEGEWYDKQQRRRHEEHFLRFFRQRTTALLMTNADHVRDVNYAPRRNPDVDILSFHKRPWTGHCAAFAAEFQTEPVRVVFESEPVPSFGDPQLGIGSEVTLDVLRGAVWERALSGCGWVAQNDTSFGWAAKCAMARHADLRDTAYDQIGYAARFFNGSGIRFWEMTPHGELTSTGMCLARPGEEYVVYTPTDSAFTVNLAEAKGKRMCVRWYDPRQGQFRGSEGVDGGGSSHSFTPPFPGDAVLYLRNVSEGAPPESLLSPEETTR